MYPALRSVKLCESLGADPLNRWRSSLSRRAASSTRRPGRPRLCRASLPSRRCLGSTTVASWPGKWPSLCQDFELLRCHPSPPGRPTTWLLSRSKLIWVPTRAARVVRTTRSSSSSSRLARSAWKPSAPTSASRWAGTTLSWSALVSGRTFPTSHGCHCSLCLGFLDHALRQGPSERMRLIKRTLFNEYSQTKRLNSTTEAIKGIYSAIRLNEVSGVALSLFFARAN